MDEQHSSISETETSLELNEPRSQPGAGHPLEGTPTTTSPPQGRHFCKRIGEWVRSRISILCSNASRPCLKKVSIRQKTRRVAGDDVLPARNDSNLNAHISESSDSLAVTLTGPEHSPNVTEPKHGNRFLSWLRLLRGNTPVRPQKSQSTDTERIQQPCDFNQVNNVTQLGGVQDLTEKDVVLLVVGPTGTGKSTFIQTLVGEQFAHVVEVGDSLSSKTEKFNAIRITFNDRLNMNLVLVDTPGFDDPERSDEKIMGIILQWLRRDKSKRQNVTTRILYMLRIIDPRVSSSVARNIRLLRAICGEAFYKNAFLVTTMWPDPSDGTYGQLQNRVKELGTDYWEGMVEKVFCFKNTLQSAQNIVNALTCPDKPRHDDVQGRALGNVAHR